MTVKIQKLLSGGGMGMLYHADPDPAVASLYSKQTGSAAEGGSSGKASGLLSNETLNELRKHGLTNEVDKFEQIYAQAEEALNAGVPLSSQRVAQLRALANRLINNHEAWDKAYKVSEDNKSLGDIAIDPTSNSIYVLNTKGKLEKVAFDKFNAQKQRAITYGELLEYRRTAPELIDNSSVIQNVQTSIGTEKINEFIQNILSKVGEAETKQEAHLLLGQLGITGALSQQEYASLQRLAAAAEQIGLDEVFKSSELYRSKHTQAAIQYIWNVLPNNMKKQLQGNFIAQGHSYRDSQTYPFEVIQQAALMTNKTAYHFEMDHVGGLGNGSKGDQYFNLKPVTQWLEGSINQGTFTFSDPSEKNQFSITLKGSVMQVLSNDDGNKVTDPMPLGEALGRTIGGYLDYNRIFMGQKEIQEGMLNQIVYSNSEVANVYLPTDGNGNIDWKSYEGYKRAIKYIEKNHITDPTEQANVHSREGSFITINEKGQEQAVRPLERFAAINGYTSSKFSRDGNNFYFEVDKDNAKKIIERAYTKKMRKELGIDDMEGTGLFRSIDVVPIFIRLKNYATDDAYLYEGHGPRVQNQTMNQVMGHQQAISSFQQVDADSTPLFK